MKNYLKIGRYHFVNGLWDDGSLWVSRDGRIFWHVDPPTWIVTLYARMVRHL